MKVLIIYSTKWGVSLRCAQMLEEKLSEFCTVSTFDIQDGAPAPDGFDVAVIGGSVRMGRINKVLRTYLKTNAEKLNAIDTALFLCCGFTENFDDYVSMNFPKSIFPSLGIHCFGGELKPEKLKGFDKFIVKRVRATMKYEQFDDPDPNASPLPEIVPETIWRLSDAIRRLL
jgi:menaquinone-dependent protoporphyrinogen oxidase